MTRRTLHRNGHDGNENRNAGYEYGTIQAPVGSSGAQPNQHGDGNGQLHPPNSGREGPYRGPNPNQYYSSTPTAPQNLSHSMANMGPAHGGVNASWPRVVQVNPLARYNPQPNGLFNPHPGHTSMLSGSHPGGAFPPGGLSGRPGIDRGHDERQDRQSDGGRQSRTTHAGQKSGRRGRTRSRHGGGQSQYSGREQSTSQDSFDNGFSTSGSSGSTHPRYDPEVSVMAPDRNENIDPQRYGGGRRPFAGLRKDHQVFVANTMAERDADMRGCDDPSCGCNSTRRPI